MNDLQAYSFSKKHDQALVEWLLKSGVEAQLATEDEDRREKWDILAGSCKIDTKYPHARLNQKTQKLEVWLEFSKLCGPATRHVDQVWYFIQGEHQCQLMLERSALVELLVSKYDARELELQKSKSAKSGANESDMICYVAVDELKKIALAQGVQEWIQKTLQ